ncbi:AraC family transcriptional regulator [Brachybacterium hainanense]|uniref:AraC family transcriptional regulator n=1 Tax=Brachybacterium hainanense TaxID=1541174 RepID=A0ABV6RDA4_9MICO
MPDEDRRSWAHYPPLSHSLRDAALCCRGAGEQSGPLPEVRGRRLSQHALVLVTAGSGTLRIGPATAPPQPIREPSWFWLDPGTVHSYGPDPGGWSEHWVLFEGISTRAYRPHAPGSGADGCEVRPLEPGPGIARIGTIFSELRAATARPGPRAQLHAASLVHRLLGELIGLGGPEPEETSLADLLVRTAAEDITIPQRARRAGVREAELRAEVRSSTGLTPHELVLTTRLAQAQSLLAGTDLPIARVAEQTGFADPSYFTRLFSQRIGLAPRDFRAQQRRGTHAR